MDTSKAYFFVPACVLRVKGPDALSFLQGQFSNDLRGAERGGCAYGLWLDRKGRILADSFVSGLAEDEFLVTSYYGKGEAVEKRLSDYLVMDEVELEDCGARARGLSIWGGAGDEALRLLDLSPPEPGRCRFDNGVLAYWGRRGKSPVLDLIFLDSAADALERVEALMRQRADLQLLDEYDIADMAVRDVTPRVGLDVGSGDLPQEAGLVEEAVSFNKGCYLGQEVMARLRSMGRTRRQLAQIVFGAEAADWTLPCVLGDASGKKRGEARALVKDGDGYIGLAMLAVGCDPEGLRPLANSDHGGES